MALVVEELSSALVIPGVALDVVVFASVPSFGTFRVGSVVTEVEEKLELKFMSMASAVERSISVVED